MSLPALVAATDLREIVQVRLVWPAWKSCSFPCFCSHPGTPTHYLSLSGPPRRCALGPPGHAVSSPAGPHIQSHQLLLSMVQVRVWPAWKFVRRVEGPSHSITSSLAVDRAGACPRPCRPLARCSHPLILSLLFSLAAPPSSPASPISPHPLPLPSPSPSQTDERNTRYEAVVQAHKVADGGFSHRPTQVRIHLHPDPVWPLYGPCLAPVWPLSDPCLTPV